MKKSFLMLVAAVALMCSCDKSDGLADLLSFSFKASLNSSVLTSDCDAVITGTDVVIALPKDADYSALIPTFTLSADDVLFIDGVEVESGVTPCNFSKETTRLTVKDGNFITEYILKVNQNDGTAELVSFGFYAADNASLAEDYLPKEIEPLMIVRIPDGGTGKTLKARIQAGFGDVISVDGKEISGNTVEVDCTFPIDITITDPVADVKVDYEVKVGKILGLDIKKLATYVEDGQGPLYGELSMAINPKDGVPYFAYTRKDVSTSSSSSRRQAAVVKYENGAFTMVGTSGMGMPADNSAQCVKIAFSADGVPFVGYIDQQHSSGMTVRKLEGDWNLVGNAGFGLAEKPSTSYDTACRLFIDQKTGNPVMIWSGSTKNASAYRSTATGIFDGSEWNIAAIGGAPVVASSTNAFLSASNAVIVGDAIYVMPSYNNGGFYLYKYANGAFTLESKAYEGMNYSSELALAADAEGNLYMFGAYMPEGATAYVSALNKYDASKKEFTQMGSTIPTNYGVKDGSRLAMAVDNESRIFGVYATPKADDPNIKVSFFDGESMDWTEWLTLSTEDVLSSKSSQIQFAFNKDGMGYLAFIADTTPLSMVLYQVKMEADILPE